MMSLSAIADLARQQAVKAAAYELVPYVPADREEPLRWRTVPIPNIGDYRPEGWCLIESVMVDKTGFGASWEPAMTLSQFQQWVSDKVGGAQNMGWQAGFAIIEEGQFQCYIGYFTDDPLQVAECDDSREAYEITWCEACGDPYEGSESECPTCGYDPDACPDCECNPCECPPFEVDDLVVFINDRGTRVEGRVIRLDAHYEEIDIETADRLIFEKLPWDEAEHAYDPTLDPNQLPLNL